MKIVLSVLFVSVIGFSSYANDTVINCRDYYYSVCLSQKSIQDFEVFLDLCKESKNTSVKGYRSVALFLWADFYFNPVKKMKFFNKGKEMLEQLIMSNPNNIELRFLRLTIQDNVPGFLGYNKSIEKDKAFINRELDNVVNDKDLYVKISSYLCCKWRN